MSTALIRAQRQLMSDWSEEHWCAGWMLGLEEELWHGSNTEMRWFDQAIADIHEIARQTGVWCEYERDVPLAEWEAKHGPPLSRMTDPEPTPAQRAALERVWAKQRAWLEELGDRYGLEAQP